MRKSVIRHRMKYALDAVGPYWTNWGRYEGDAVEIEGILYPEGVGEMVLKPASPSVPQLILKGQWKDGEFVKGSATSANPKITAFESISGKWDKGEWQGGRVNLGNNDFFEGEWQGDTFNMTKMRYSTKDDVLDLQMINKPNIVDIYTLAKGRILSSRGQVKEKGVFAVEMPAFNPDDIATQFVENGVSCEQLLKKKQEHQHALDKFER